MKLYVIKFPEADLPRLLKYTSDHNINVISEYTTLNDNFEIIYHANIEITNDFDLLQLMSMCEIIKTPESWIKKYV